MASNIFNSLKRKARNSRNAFDLSRKHVFSAKAGQLLPCLCVETVPGSHYQIKVKDLVRTFKVQTDAFARISYSYDFYFVPFSQLWHGFNEFYTQRKDTVSSREQGTVFVPNFSLQDVYSNTGSSSVDIMQFNELQGRYRLLDLLGYGNVMPTMENAQGKIPEDVCDAADIVRMNPFRALAYQKIWSDFYRNPYWDTNVDAECFNVDNINPTNESTMRISRSQVNKMFTLRYRCWKKDLFTGALPNPAFDGVAVSYVTFGDAEMPSRQTYPFERLTYPQSSNLGNDDTFKSFGFQAGMQNHATRLETDGETIVPNFAGVAVTTADGFPLAVDVLSLRKAEALQKWSETVLRQGYRTSDQFEGFFGVSPRFDSKNHPLFLGSFSGVVNIDEVVQSGGNNQSIGDIYGKGIGTSRGDEIQFDASDFGVIMCVLSFLPEAEYNSLGLDKANRMIEPFDFFNPAFDDLGFEAVPTADVNVVPLLDDIDNYEKSLNTVLGYVPRFYNYKTAYDKVFGEFFKAVHGTNEYPRNNGYFHLWVAPRIDYQIDAIIDSRGIGDYYVNPDTLDSIFVQQADDNQNTDQFIVNAYFDVVGVQPMSVLGLPQW